MFSLVLSSEPQRYAAVYPHMFHQRWVGQSVAAASSSSRLRVLQLNCLTHWSASEEADVFNKRMDLHFQHIAALQPAVVVLEEVDGPLTLPAKCLSLGTRLSDTLRYHAVFNAKGNTQADQTWILVDRERLDLVRHDTLRLEGASQFALVALLREKETGNHVLVVAMHAKAGRNEECEAQRILHTADIVTRIRAMSHYAPVVAAGRALWVGDFNAGPHSYNGTYPCKWYETAVSGLLEPLGFTSAYKAFLGAEPEYTTVKMRDGSLIAQTIDYIFFQPHGFCIGGILALPTRHEIPEHGLPFDQWGSDHLSLACDFEFASGTPR